ncbi:hypothetical protein E1298_41060 [Actinomadura rubrisoli]|uniref:Uncharacterized protein n=2 Tax=Actinomadura rubrisoli TaxID=2530368 RepID=A0A4R5A4X1_9ACTN|nr:hypothetical protein E1298_41060 [Actinomadura rubrisoli]
MRKDLAQLQYSLTTLGVQAGTVGGWDVAQQLGPKVDTAHKNMIAGIKSYCRAYEQAIARVELCARNYGKAEHAATEAARNAGRPVTPSNVSPWQNY